ncbi:hypothetical protein, partial [uncultured Mobiluncus sp.]|uniref:hypothetical protein n=1 Tax=uncultured Mobiluncus sp. TaxID=293425 RepID=UPI0025D57AA0
ACLQRLIKPKHVSGGPAGGFIRGQGSGAQFCVARLLAPWRVLRAILRSKIAGTTVGLRGILRWFFPNFVSPVVSLEDWS